MRLWRRLAPASLHSALLLRLSLLGFACASRCLCLSFKALCKQIVKTKDKAAMPSDSNQAAYARAIYAHLRSLTEGFKKAAKVVRVVNNKLASRRGGSSGGDSTRRTPRSTP